MSDMSNINLEKHSNKILCRCKTAVNKVIFLFQIPWRRGHSFPRHFQKKGLKAIAFVLALSFLAPALSAGEKEITVAAVGDCVISRKISNSRDPGLLKLLELLRRADCAYGNCETAFFDPVNGYPAYKTFPGPHHFCLPFGAEELKWAGFDLVSLANDHIMDFTYDGLSSTLHHLDRAGIAYAGAGKDLEHASRPGYFDSSGGTVSLISCASFFENYSPASEVHPHLDGRPGLNPIHVTFEIQVEPALLARLDELKDNILNAVGVPVEKRDVKYVESISIGPELLFIKGDGTGFVLKPKEKSPDLERIHAAVKVAANNSRLVMASLHEHRGMDNNSRPTKFQQDFARKCIDSGADMFVGAGSHVLWGLEIYKDKPIFHGLGNFFFHEVRAIAAETYKKVGLPVNTMDPMLYAAKFDKYLKSERYWESVVPIVTFGEGNKIKRIELYPIVLEKDVSLAQRGTPRLAEGERAAAILQRFKELSQAYGTKVVIDRSKGVIEL